MHIDYTCSTGKCAYRKQQSSWSKHCTIEISTLNIEASVQYASSNIHDIVFHTMCQKHLLMITIYLNF